ncbi:hypothetical protein KC19_VG130300 [Ceratodon purpureus]|uniref:Uncharacterized protein n=1 Tax=Ceratodon purpureus TaxID=3225 RepID=A0A8T0HPP1_CERPU|nr:hypothetical protein KC19_VG130300 [Ceratodon purpureus]
MDQWSPRTKLRYGLCVEDDQGNIVSVWNFGELDDLLRDFESDDDSEVQRDVYLSENGAELEQDSKLATEDYEGMRVATFGKTELQDVVFPRVSHVSYSDMVQNVLLLLVICVSSNVDSSIFVELLRLLLQMRV